MQSNTAQPVKVVLVDDESHCIQTLTMQIKALDIPVEIVATFNNPVKAYEFISNNSFDLLFLDIEMPGLSGFELLSRFSDFHFDVIFTTAYNQYAIQAFRYQALNYLLKPVEDSELSTSFTLWMNKQDKRLGIRQFEMLVRSIDNPGNLGKRIALPVSNGFEFIQTDKIIRCQADNYYTNIFMDDNKSYLICRTLKEVESLLKPLGFIRIHQSHLINTHHITKYSRQDGGAIVTSDDTTILVSKNYKPQLTKFLEEVGFL